MRFVHGREILDEVRVLVGQQGDVSAAVAFWGRKAATETRLSRKRNGKVRILCDLFSGACNPDEILKLVERKGVQVRRLSGMHAKVWVNKHRAIVGSANASTNGLGFEGANYAGGNLEAAVVLDDTKVVRAVKAWFDDQWRNEGSHRVGASDVEEARNIWMHRRSHAPGGPLKNSTLLVHLETNGSTAEFPNLRIVAYRDWSILPETEAYWDAKKRLHYSDEELKRLEDFFPFYELERRSSFGQIAGTVYLDYVCSSARGKFYCDDHFWKVRDSGPIFHLEDYKLILLSPEPDFEGYRFPKKERDTVARMVKCCVNEKGWFADPEHDFSYLDEKFALFYLNKRRSCMRRSASKRCGRCPWNNA